MRHQKHNTSKTTYLTMKVERVFKPWGYRCKVPAHPRRMNRAKYTHDYFTTQDKLLINLRVYLYKTPS